MAEFVWQTLQRLDGIAGLGLFNLTVDVLVKLTDFSRIQDLIDMGLIVIDPATGSLVVLVDVTPDTAEAVAERLQHLAIRRAVAFGGAQAEPLEFLAILDPSVTLH